MIFDGEGDVAVTHRRSRRLRLVSGQTYRLASSYRRVAIVPVECRAVGPHVNELDALIDAAENAEDIASVRAWKAYVAAVGRDAAIANSYTGAEAKRLLDGESPVRIWREKRGMTQRALAATIPAGYLSEIESRRKPGSVAAYRAATVLAVPMEDLVETSDAEAGVHRLPSEGPARAWITGHSAVTAGRSWLPGSPRGRVPSPCPLEPRGRSDGSWFRPAHRADGGMALDPEAVRRSTVVLIRLPRDKARPAVVARSDLLDELSYATVLLITSELRAGISLRIDVPPTAQTGLRSASQVTVDWLQKVWFSDMGPAIRQLMRRPALISGRLSDTVYAELLLITRSTRVTS